MDMDDLGNCNICMETYDDNVRPRSLNCGHSFCTSCMDNFIARKSLVCPHCQQSHSVSSAHSLPINYGMEQMISNLRGAQLIVDPSQQSGATAKKGQSTTKKGKFETQISSNQSETIYDKLLSVIQEQTESTQNLVRESKEMQSHLDQYKNFLLERKVKHEDLFQKVMDLANRNKDIVEEINTEYEKVTEIQKKGEALENVVNVKLESLSRVSDTQTAVDACNDHDNSYAALKEWTKYNQEHIPNVNTISCSEKVVRETTAALSMMVKEEVEAVSGSLDLSQISLPIMNKLDMIRETPLSVKCLQNMSKHTKHILERGLLYAVQEKDGRLRSAKVTVKDNKTYLHYLQDGAPPVYAQTLKQSDLIRTLENDSVVAFMDLAWEGSIQGRIHILLYPGTPLGQQFRILCSGDFGPSYAHSRFLEVVLKGDAVNERVNCGDYEHNDGTGGAPIIRGINVNEQIYKRKCAPGIVWARCGVNGGPTIAQFTIFTGTGSGADFLWVFGEVQEGLDVVRAAVKRDDIFSVTIADCGVVLPFRSG